MSITGFIILIVDIIVWQKVKNTEKTPSPFFSVDTQLLLYSSAYGHFFFLQHWKGGGGILGLF